VHYQTSIPLIVGLYSSKPKNCQSNVEGKEVIIIAIESSHRGGEVGEAGSMLKVAVVEEICTWTMLSHHDFMPLKVKEKDLSLEMLRRVSNFL